MSRYIRHDAGPHNRGKARHHIKCFRGQVKGAWTLVAKLRRTLAELDDAVRFIEGRLCRIDNRLESEDRSGGRDQEKERRDRRRRR
jgi:hypothetical protein